MNQPQIVVYTTDWCPDCWRAKKVLDEHKIDYSWVDIEQDLEARAYVERVNNGKLILSLDVPSGLDATTGEAPGLVVRPNRTVTLALPKTGLKGASDHLYLADFGIPPQVFYRLGVSLESPFKRDCCIRLVSTQRDGSPTRTPPDR